MMSRLHFRETENYKWSPTSILGKGTFGCVYKGFLKRNDEVVVKVAIKTADINSNSAAEERLKIEAVILSKCVRQSNILQFISYEPEVVNGRPGKYVLITELCDPVSLGVKLQHPEYQQGFDDEEFRNFLSQFTAGLKFLVQEAFAKANIKILHRDIKAHNILMSTTSNGFVTYKIGDFGSSKIADDDNINSINLHGSLLNINPKVFLAHFDNNRERLNSNTECWSVSTLLYHVLTGRLPFEFTTTAQSIAEHIWMMKWLANSKDFGVISAKCVRKESSEGNGVENVSKSLPANIKIGPYTRVCMTDLIRRMLEIRDETKALTLDKYFDNVAIFLKKDPVPIFYLNGLKFCTVYVEYESNWSEFQMSIERQIGVKTDQQLLILNGESIEIRLNCKGENLKSILLQVTEAKPLILLSPTVINSLDQSKCPSEKQEKSVNAKWNSMLVKKRFKQLNDAIDESHSFPCLQKNAKYAFDCHQQIISDCRLNHLIKYSVENITNFLQSIALESSFLTEKYIQVKNDLELMKKIVDTLTTVTGAKRAHHVFEMSKVKIALLEIEQSFLPVDKKLKEIQNPVAAQNLIRTEIDDPFQQLREKADIVLQKIKEINADDSKRERSVISISRIRKGYDDLKQLEDSVRNNGHGERVHEYLRELQRNVPAEIYKQLDPVFKNLKVFEESSIQLLEILKGFCDMKFYTDFVDCVNDWYDEICPLCFKAAKSFPSLLKDKQRVVEIKDIINSASVSQFLVNIDKLLSVVRNSDGTDIPPSEGQKKKLQKLRNIIKKSLEQQRELNKIVDDVKTQADSIFKLNDPKRTGDS